MGNRAYALVAECVRTGKEVCFLVVSDDEEKVGWEFLAAFPGQSEDYRFLKSIPLVETPDLENGFIGSLGPKCSVPSKEPTASLSFR